MLKKTLSLLLLGGMIMLLFGGCFFLKHNVFYYPNKSDFVGAEDSFRKGKNVTLYYTDIQADTEYSFYVEGEKITPEYSEDKGYVISFKMPGNDITVSVESKRTYEKDEGKPAELSLNSFDGGGPEFTVTVSDTQIVKSDGGKRYYGGKRTYDAGTPYTVLYTFFGLREGETEVKIEARSPTGINYDEVYTLSVDAELNVTLTLKDSTKQELTYNN